MTSNFERSAESSKPAPHTTVNGNSKRSSRKRVHPDGIDPVGVSQSAMRIAARRVPAGAALVASTFTPSSCTAFCTMGVLAAFAVTYRVPAG